MSAVRIALLLVSATSPSSAQDTTAVRAVNDSISVRFVDTDIRGVIQALGRYLPKPVLVGSIQPARVSLETPMFNRTGTSLSKTCRPSRNNLKNGTGSNCRRRMRRA